MPVIRIACRVVVTLGFMGLLLFPSRIRLDSGKRSAEEDLELSTHLHLQWVRELPPLQPAWPDQPKLQFDAVYRPVVAGELLIVPSNRTDGVTAYDTETGEERWTFVTDGPVRFAPTLSGEYLYTVSDDGHLYCLDAETGEERWKVRGGPSERKILGNQRLISTWPARGAPVVNDGTVYFAAGIWPFMGIFLQAVDAETGQILWTNSGDGSLFIKQPHQTDAFGGVAPQGELVVVGDKLLVASGRSVPACYDRHTGKLLHFRLADNGQRGGGWKIQATEDVFLNGGYLFDMATGDSLAPVGEPALLYDDALISSTKTEVKIQRIAHPFTTTVTDRKGSSSPQRTWSATDNVATTIDVKGAECLLRRGNQLFVASGNRVRGYAVNPDAGGARLFWEAEVSGTVGHLSAGNQRLFVVTKEGKISCFGEAEKEPIVHLRREYRPAPSDTWTEDAHAILEKTGIREGYCVCWGVGSGRLIEELVRQTKLSLVVVESDHKKVEALREEMIAAELYGVRVAVYQGSPDTCSLPPYFTELMVSETLTDAGVRPKAEHMHALFQCLRPYGGTFCFPMESEQRFEFDEVMRNLHMSGARNLHRSEDTESYLCWTRSGALPETANWTHEHADAANTRVSRDGLVKAPLGILWFGGSSHEGILPRHGHGPQPQVIDGRLIIEGTDKMRALDIYTGRVLWETSLPDIGKPYNNTAHQPGANGIGSNFASTSDGIYVLYGEVCVRLDPATGKIVKEFKAPTMGNQGSALRWTTLRISGDYIIAGLNPQKTDEEDEARQSDPHSSSKYLAVVHRETGQLQWTKTARTGFRNNSMCVGGGRVYCIDRLSGAQLSQLRRRGGDVVDEAEAIAFDLVGGEKLWSSEKDVFGTWLSYSDNHDVLIEAGLASRDTLGDEPLGMRAYRCRDGIELWYEKGHKGPAMIRGNTILRDGGACDLLTGVKRQWTDPISGQSEDWIWSRTYGCNTPAASEHLLTFRSGAAGYYDLCNDGGTGNLGGFRSSCTNNLVVAGGLLVVPDYTRTCVCSYQNQTSVGLIHMPEAEMWTFQGSASLKAPVKRVGINLGAPGDRKADDGTLWLEFPSVGGTSPSLSIRTTPEKLDCFRKHSALVSGDGLKWVAGSGGRGLTSLTVTLDPQATTSRNYRVRLHFLEPDHLEAGERVFDVALQGATILEGFDVAKVAGGADRPVVREFNNVAAGKELTLTLTPKGKLPAVLSGIEIVAEGW